MIFKIWVLLALFILTALGAECQVLSVDSVKIDRASLSKVDSTIQSISDSLNKKEVLFMPVPKTATRWGLIPGGGQIYNKDYWKLPIIYLGIGGGIYTYYLNNLKYNDFLSAYKSFYDLNKNSIDKNGMEIPNPNYGKVYGASKRPVLVRNLFNTSQEIAEANIDQIKRQKNYWRRNKNLSIIVAGLIYSLTIVEANVAAHLKTFDLSEDISLRIEPKLQQPNLLTPTPGLRLVFNLK